MLKICLNIHEPYLAEALQELLSQVEGNIVTHEQDGDCVLFTPPFTGTERPSLNFFDLSRPLRFVELLATLESLPYSKDIHFSHFSLDLREKLLKNLNTQHLQRLTEKECEILYFFYQHRGVDLSKNTLLQAIWNYHPDVETHTLETHIYRLRQKLEEDPNNPQIILNGKEGYILNDVLAPVLHQKRNKTV